MIEIKNVRGTQTEVQALEINVDTVYIRVNIVAIDEPDFKGWQYDEVQYGKDEYIKLIGEKNQALEVQLTETQLAITEIYEGMA
jgi:hypothetical protein